jgi:two-component system, NtrC family, nitrogen regulation response regulator NtrX
MEDALTVLVLDDDPGVRSSMERLLQVYGYTALSASTLDEAQVVLKTRSVQALILDVGLQGDLTGLDLLRSIRARPEFDKAPILIFTGGVLSDAEEALITRHRAFLFYKPEGFDTLINFLDTLTGRDRPN